ncbi:MAG: polysaccharide deacetylase family protein [Deltaproteobacteria bacterium]|nr:MAG: polysaccharide deacetylase family protein [Deltaproteobacteria bacterium]
MRHFLIALNVVAPVALIPLAMEGHFWWGLGAVFVAHMLALFATLVPGSSWWGPVVREFATKDDEVWLTIDDGPDPEDTPAVLELLAQYDARATFFLIGEKVRRWPELAQAIVRAGHRVENHTSNHALSAFWRFGPRRLREEIEGGHRAIVSATGKEPAFLRTPAGMRNCFLHPILKQMGVPLVGWTVRGRDGVSTDRDAIVARLEGGLRRGAILLMHESKRDSEGRSVIVDTLPRVLEAIQTRGLRAVVPEAVPQSTS